MRYLIVGDIHCKYSILDVIEDKIDNYDKVIFLGDYVDDWLASPEASFNTLEKLLRLWQTYPSKIILLLGNHDCSYLFGEKFRCSGYNPETESYVKDLYKTTFDGESPLHISYADGNYLFTHAGVTRHFWNDMLALIQKHYPGIVPYGTLAEQISQALNHALELGKSDQHDRLFQMLTQVGSTRGGFGTPSPLWADKRELEEDHISGINQVVGHTPVRTVTLTNLGKNKLFFCDTHSSVY